MEQAIITFANGEKITISDNDLLFPIIRQDTNGDIHTARTDPFEITSDAHFGIVLKITDLLIQCDFFSVSEKYNNIYKSDSVVSIERV